MPTVRQGVWARVSRGRGVLGTHEAQKPKALQRAARTFVRAHEVVTYQGLDDVFDALLRHASLDGQLLDVLEQEARVG